MSQLQSVKARFPNLIASPAISTDICMTLISELVLLRFYNRSIRHFLFPITRTLAFEPRVFSPKDGPRLALFQISTLRGASATFVIQ